MAITYINMEFAGQADTQPRRGCMVTTDSLETITTAGYLNNNQNTAGINFYANDFIFVNYNSPLNGINGGNTELFTLSIDGVGIITLSSVTPDSVQDVTLGISEAEKMLTLDSDSQLDGLPWDYYSAAALANNDAKANTVASVVTISTTPAASLSCAAQFQMRNAAGSVVNTTAPIMFYVSGPSGTVAPGTITGITALINGTVATVSSALYFLANPAAGLLGITLTADPGTYYVSFILPNGQISTSSGMLVNA